MSICDWRDFDANVKSLSLKISQGEKSSECFPILSLTDSLYVQFNAAKIWSSDKYPLNTSLGPIFKYSYNKKIKIGYFSADFRDHPVSVLCAGLFEAHDKSKFELIGFYSGPENSSVMHRRVASAFDIFIDIRLKEDKEVAELSRNIGIDIAVDLTGIMEYGRVGVFSYRAAPIQLSYIGYLGTMGASYYDYIIADNTIIPTESQPYYVEKIVYLPSYQVNDSKRQIPRRLYSKAELNLPETGFIFCCFNNNYKMTPTTFDSWMRILSAIPDSVLLIYAGNTWAEENIKMEAKKRGVTQNRIVFGSRIGTSENLARYKCADLFLDTLPYNAGTTASDAIWAGLPLLTCMGNSFASRVAASLLNAIELPELIATSQEQYEAKAINLATDPSKIKTIKEKLERHRMTTALFDTSRFTKHIEAAYSKMYERYQADLLPDHIHIENE
jgi:predicted O-linked N-acetylglucosamine transferase (SPINDLY family)